MKPTRLEALPPLARELATEALEWMEPFGDAGRHVLRYPSSHGQYTHFDRAKMLFHPVRETAWWAATLLLRNRGDDVARAERIFDAVLAWQYNEPGTPYHGTFARALEEVHPPENGAVIWRDYDPNWRQFIGMTFLIVLEMLPDRLSPELKQKLEASVKLATEGEVPGRLTANYTNIAMMHAVLLVNAGARFNQPEWTERGVALAREIYALFTRHGSYDEYNSPTYYGVDMYALRLWQLISPRPELVELGAAMEQSLWRDIAAFYHPSLRNMCGPFDRSYGMDMTRYVAKIGMFLRLELPVALAPLPDTSRDFDHAHDFAIAPQVAMLSADFPDDVRALLHEPVVERRVERVIEGTRIATAFLGREWMWGGQRGSKGCGWSQLHLATAHWQQPDGGVGWLRLENGMFVDVTADSGGLHLRAANGADVQPLTWHFSTAPRIENGAWIFPGMTVRVTGDRAEWKASSLTLTHTMAPQTTLSLELAFEPDAEA